MDTKGMLGKLFGLKARNTKVRTEFIAGTTTFMTMAYIILVNPAILSVAVPHGAQADLCNSVLYRAEIHIPLILNEALAMKLHYPMGKIFVNMDKYGNTSAASIPIALHEAVAAKRIRDNDLILFAAFGSGLTWGASPVKW